jgi:hypothetical protein
MTGVIFLASSFDASPEVPEEHRDDHEPESGQDIVEPRHTGLLSGYVCGLSAAEFGENLHPRWKLIKGSAEGYLCHSVKPRERGGVAGERLSAFPTQVNREGGLIPIGQGESIDDQRHISGCMLTIHRVLSSVGIGKSGSIIPFGRE